MEKNSSDFIEESDRAKEIFQDKDGVLIQKWNLLGLSQAKFNKYPPQKRQRGLLEFSRTLFSLLCGVSSEDY